MQFFVSEQRRGMKNILKGLEILIMPLLFLYTAIRDCYDKKINHYKGRKINKLQEKKNKKEKINKKWAIQAFALTFVLSSLVSFVSDRGVQNLNIVASIIILIAVILVGIIFDIIGVAVTVAEEEDFHAKATKKAKGAKTSLKLIKNATKVANICADVIGDICGVVSGAISAMIAIKIATTYNVSNNVQFLVSALVASLTVSGKAIGKDIAKNNSTKIVELVGKMLNRF